MSDGPTESLNQHVIKASQSGDVKALVSLFADDALFMPPNDTNVYGVEEIRSWWEDYFTSFSIVSNVLTERDLTVAGNQAFERTAFTGTIVPKKDGAKILDEIRTLIVWKRQPGDNWKISHLIWNSVKPVGAGTNRYMNLMMQKKGRSS
jgi:ketosteroid isomerase-like protein